MPELRTARENARLEIGSPRGLSRSGGLGGGGDGGRSLDVEDGASRPRWWRRAAPVARVLTERLGFGGAASAAREGAGLPAEVPGEVAAQRAATGDRSLSISLNLSSSYLLIVA